jgi:hypothetical protein
MPLYAKPSFAQHALLPQKCMTGDAPNKTCDANTLLNKRLCYHTAVLQAKWHPGQAGHLRCARWESANSVSKAQRICACGQDASKQCIALQLCSTGQSFVCIELCFACCCAKPHGVCRQVDHVQGCGHVCSCLATARECCTSKAVSQ